LICGTNSLISIFSISNPGPPRISIPTKTFAGSTKGIISALSESPDGILAAGTYNNIVSLMSPAYEHITTFQTGNKDGITELKWSPNSRYLYIIPRKSTEIQVWDIRSTGDIVGVLKGREALTNQRIWTDLTRNGLWMVSGGMDGIVRGWDVSNLGGTMSPSFGFAAHGGSLADV
jgi:telomerase Cajal body protein 1